MCCCSLRCSVLFAGVWCLVQGIAWAVLAFLGIQLYTCELDISFDLQNPTYFLYFIYFFNRECASFPDELDFYEILKDILGLPSDTTTPSGFTTPDIDFTTPFAIPSWPDKFGPVDYTHNVMLAYAVLSTTWAVTSCIIVVAGVFNVRSWFAYAPWILVTAANILLDVVATIHFASDASESRTAQGLIETLIGVDLGAVPQEYKDKLYGHNQFKNMDGLSMIPSLVMVLLSSRAVILWLLNVFILICVSVTVCRSSKKKGQKPNSKTYPDNRPNVQLSGKQNSYIEEPRTNNPDPQHDYTYATGYSRPFSYLDSDPKEPSSSPPRPLTNNALSSSVAAPGATRYSRTTQPLYMELRDPKPQYETPSAASDNYERQPRKRVPVPSELKGNNGLDDLRTAPYIGRTDSDISYQPPVKNRPASNIAIPRADKRTAAPEPDQTYLEPRHNSFASPDNYDLPSLPRLPVLGDLKENNGPDEQRKAPHVRRTDSDRPTYRPQPLPTNLIRRPTTYDEINPLETKTSQTSQDRFQEPNRNIGHRASGSLPRPSGSLPPDELRSQLPWSYFGPRDAPMKPKPKPEAVVDEELEMPPVPVPDYTLHFGKMARPVTSKWSDDKSSTAPHVADHRGNSASGVDRNNSFLKRSRY